MKRILSGLVGVSLLTAIGVGVQSPVTAAPKASSDVVSPGAILQKHNLSSKALSASAPRESAAMQKASLKDNKISLPVPGSKVPSKKVARQGPAPTLTPYSNYYWMITTQDVSADPIDGDQITMTMAKPYLAHGENPAVPGQSDSHSLQQTWVVGGNNTVEYGIQVAQWRGDTNAHFFTFAARDGYSTYQVCYDLCVDNTTGQPFFKSYKGQIGFSPYAPGDAVPAADYGTNKHFRSQHYDNTTCPGCAGWWISYNDLWMGYYPDSVWTSIGQTFTTANRIDHGGEINVNYAESCTDMGVGDLASSTAGSVMSGDLFIGSTLTPNTNAGLGTPIGTAWGAWSNSAGTELHFGGPGYNSIGNAGGTKSACAPTSERAGVVGSIMFNRQLCPDGQSVTGCDQEFDQAYSTAVINACHAIPAAQQDIYQAWNDSQSSGKAFYVYATTTCGSTRYLITNASKNTQATWGFSPHGWARAS